jgi:hypothetical protein
MRWQSLSLSFASVIEKSNLPCLAAPPHFSHPWAPVCSSALPVEAATDAAPSSHRCRRPRLPSSPSSRASSSSHCTMKNCPKVRSHRPPLLSPQCLTGVGHLQSSSGQAATSSTFAGVLWSSPSHQTPSMTTRPCYPTVPHFRGAPFSGEPHPSH